MFTFLLIFNIIISLASLIIGLLPILKGSRDRQDISFSILAFLAGIWTLSNFLGSNTSGELVSEILIKTDFMSGLLLVNMFWIFSYYTRQRFLGQEYKASPVVLTTMLSIIVSLLILSNQIITVSQSDGLVVSNQKFYPLYLVLAGLYMLMGIRELVRARNGATGIRRAQVNTMLLGLVIAALLVAIPNLILENLLEKGPFLILTYDLAYVGIFTFLALSAYSIVRHKLFDIRSVIARSVAYVLLLPILVLVYSLIIFGTTSILLQGSSEISLGQQLIYVITAVFMALSYQNAKRWFDKVTNKIFFRDAYETQAVLDGVSGVIVGNVDPIKIQKGSLEALYGSLRPTYIGFLLSTNSNQLIPGSSLGQQWYIRDPEGLSKNLRQAVKKVTVYDELEDKKVKLKEVLRAEDISVVSPLVTKDEAIGYLVLGPKKSGNIYNSQDVGLLTIASNELAVALQNAQRFEEIQAFNITLQEKVTEATRELKRTNKKLIALDEAKDEFISMASHQLRTPLTSIKGYLSMIIEGDLGKVSAAQEKALKEAFGSSQRMVYLIADFLNVSRIKTGKFVIEPKEVDLPQIVTEEITQLREMAGSRDITLEYEAPGVFPRVQLDDNKIRQVMMNMVDNAIYYTPAGGTVTIQLYVAGEEVVFKVIDTGIGVPKREQHKLFTKFFRANNARKARPDGTGLGLFMAQKIIVEQGGAIIFESTEGKGSTFGFRFPLKTIKL